MAVSNCPFQRRYPPEMRERAERMVHEAITESGERAGAVTRVAKQLGIGAESLRNWVKRAEIDSGKRPGVTTAEQQRIAELERENGELRRANEILKAASAFFAAYADIGIRRVCRWYVIACSSLVRWLMC
jgi:transposase